jgi:hypothetical protein
MRGQNKVGLNHFFLLFFAAKSTLIDFIVAAENDVGHNKYVFLVKGIAYDFSKRIDAWYY